MKTLRLGGVVAWIKRTHFKCLLVMTMLCLGVGENYPFSNFPMYSSFGSRTYFLYLTDAGGTALRTRDFGLASSTLKKIFDSYRRTELKLAPRSGSERVHVAEAAAGQALLRYLDHHSTVRPLTKELPHGLRLQHVSVHLEAHELFYTTRTVATHE